jgi:hypothetical protein
VLIASQLIGPSVSRIGLVVMMFLDVAFASF